MVDGGGGGIKTTENKIPSHLVVDVDGEEYEGVQADIDHQKEPEGWREASKQLSLWST